MAAATKAAVEEALLALAIRPVAKISNRPHTRKHACTRPRALAGEVAGGQAREKSGGARHALDNLGVGWVAIEAGGSREGGERHLSNAQHSKSRIT